MTGRATSWGAVSIVLVGAFMATLDSFIVIVAGPSIQADLGASDGQLQWVLAGYQLTYAVLLVTGGRLGDLCGRRRIFLVGMGLFTVTSVVCAVTQTATLLIGARFAQGLGAALMLPQVYAFLTVLVAERDRPRAFGVLGVVLGLASIAGQLVGGLLIGADVLDTGWRSVFWINVPIGLVTVLAALRWLPESTAAQAHRLDLRGVAVLSATVFLVTFPLIQGHEAGWPAWAWACLAASVPCLAAFVFVERRIAARGGTPLVRISLFRTRSFSVGILLVLVIYTVLTSYYLVLSVSLQDGLGMSALQAGLVYTPAAATFFVFSLIAGRLIPAHGRRVLEIGAIMLALGYAATATLLASGAPFIPQVVIPTLILQSAGGGLLVTPSLGAVLSRIDPDDAGVASGVLSTAQQVGAALGVAVIGVVYFTTLDQTGTAAHGLTMASLATLIAAVLATALVFLLPRQGTAPRNPRDERLAKAVWLREQGRHDQARSRLLALATEFPDDAEIAYQTAWIHDVLGLEAEAVPYYERSLTGSHLTTEDRRDALLGLGSTYRTLGRYTEAEHTLRQATEEFPDDAALQTFLAMALFNTGHHHEAASTLLTLLTATSQDPRIRQYQRAIDHYAQDLEAVTAAAGEHR